MLINIYITCGSYKVWYTKTWPRSVPRLECGQDIHGDIVKRDHWINIRYFDYITYFQLSGKERLQQFHGRGKL